MSLQSLAPSRREPKGSLPRIRISSELGPRISSYPALLMAIAAGEVVINEARDRPGAHGKLALAKIYVLRLMAS